MKLKDIGNSIIGGAAVCLGYTLMTSVIQTCTDPYKRALVKTKIKNVKEALVKKN